MPTVIPTNNTDLLQALARLTSQELATVFDLIVITKSRIPDSCPPEFIPWLAWERSIGSDEGWNITDTEIARRKLIENYIQKHQHKGTPSVIRRLFRDLGYGEIQIIENTANLYWNGNAVFDGTHLFGGSNGEWAKYSIKLSRPVTNNEAQKLREWLERIVPLRCELHSLDYRDHPIYWNGEITFDGSYNFGIA